MAPSNSFGGVETVTFISFHNYPFVPKLQLGNALVREALLRNHYDTTTVTRPPQKRWLSMMFPKIIENYRDYEPHAGITPYVAKALKVVPREHLLGIPAIVLTNGRALNRTRRRKNTSHASKHGDVLGWYSPDSAEITIVIDNISNMPAICSRLRFEITATLIAETLYHEIGHHIHRTKRPENGGKERIANDYMRMYWGRWLRRRWPHILLAIVLSPREVWRLALGFWQSRKL